MWFLILSVPLWWFHNSLKKWNSNIRLQVEIYYKSKHNIFYDATTLYPDTDLSTSCDRRHPTRHAGYYANYNRILHLYIKIVINLVYNNYKLL